jgi:G8 domain-containing protein
MLNLCLFVLPSLTACALLGAPGSTAYAGQDAHLHTPGVSGMPQGVPLFCGNPTIRSVGSGSWSSPNTWSTRKVPGASDKVAVGAGHSVMYDTTSDAAIECIEVGGTLSFKTDTSTRLKIVTLMVLQGGTLEIGSPDRPVAPDARAEVVIADRPFDTASDPSQVGHGIVALGKVRMHGAVKTTFLRIGREPIAGQADLTFERAVTGWKAGDRVVLPDTRQLRASESGRSYQTQTEKIEILSVSGTTVTLTKPLVFDHKGARNAAGTLELLPHAGNLTRNVVIRSENAAGTRGHTMFISHADVDIRYTEFGELGRTKMGILNNTDFDSEGRVARIGTNQIGRYAVHFHHDFGPTSTPADRYQFALVGNAVDGSSKWGITIHRSHNGLIQDNVVYNTRGAGIVTEDGSESNNIFDHNFSLQTAGSRDAAPGNGYSTVLPNPGGDGSAFWFRGPNNSIRNNVAASAAESGFGLPVTALGNIRVPKFRGADTSLAAESTLLDTDHAAVPEFSNNEAYGAVQSGVVWAWSGTIAGLKVWHTSRHAVTATPSEKVAIEGLTARGDASVLADVSQNPVGVWVANYAAKSVGVLSADVQGFRIGVSSPFFYGQAADSRQEGSLTIENSYFRTPVGVSVATSYSDPDGGSSRKKAVVRNSTFEPLTAATAGQAASGAISMNVGMSPRDARPRDPILVYDFNKQPGRNFKVYYSLQAPDSVAPCHDTMPGIDGWVCRLD